MNQPNKVTSNEKKEQTPWAHAPKHSHFLERSGCFDACVKKERLGELMQELIYRIALCAKP